MLFLKGAPESVVERCSAICVTEPSDTVPMTKGNMAIIRGIALVALLNSCLHVLHRKQ